jgi:4-hydroxy-tetrahydrodipicolinate synthase
MDAGKFKVSPTPGAAHAWRHAVSRISLLYLKLCFNFFLDVPNNCYYATVLMAGTPPGWGRAGLNRLKPMIERSQFAGVIAALLLPRDDRGRPAWDAFERNAQFVLDVGAVGLCVNGATGEFAGACPAERREAVVRARRVSGSGLVVSGIGGTRWTEILTLGREAEGAGADALLVPTPYFFSYAPEDLAEFYRRLVAELSIPVLIYNLPAFTGGLDSALAFQLIQELNGIAGVKDSSGCLDLLELLSIGRSGEVLRLVGHDAVLAEALTRGLCDGTISGVAGVLPELTVALWNSAAGTDAALFRRLASRLEALIEQLDEFPTPWGLKLIAELRGLGPASIGLPLSAQRQSEAAQFAEWFPRWWKDADADLAKALNAPVSLCQCVA